MNKRKATATRRNKEGIFYMKHLAKRKHCPALTIVELLVVIAVIAVIGFLLLPASVHRKSYPAQIVFCISNLRQVGTAFRIWTDDHGDRNPMSVSMTNGGALEYVTNGETYRIFQCMSNELSTTKILCCPADNRNPASNFMQLDKTNVSYFIGLDADESNPTMFLNGDRNLEVNAKTLSTGLVTLSTNDTLAWSQQIHNQSGNVTLADGSSQKFSSRQLQSHFQKNYTNATRLAMP